MESSSGGDRGDVGMYEEGTTGTTARSGGLEVWRLPDISEENAEATEQVGWISVIHALNPFVCDRCKRIRIDFETRCKTRLRL